nr:immunoglobulin light chain junction region [Macaca mulatta]MOV95275.1 immunoglobulin light chain junction region [Macaca mulatta]MOV95321.1 immunoglobulin light chain junction region [Macaca mulatta]MOV96069.1 immunoglobulin light chain junction region [Macaca mulatta]MOV96233.1 immunoglobulin light chain junction region [Macaca mulatta]
DYYCCSFTSTATYIF